MNETTLKTISVFNKGQITIPREIRKLLGIKKGDLLVLTIENKKLLIQRAANLEKQMEDDFKDLLKFSEKTVEKLWNNEDDEIWNNYLE